MNSTDGKYNDKEYMIQKVKKDGNFLKYGSLEIRNDKEIVLEAMKHHIYAFEYASDDLKIDKELALMAVSADGELLEELSEELKDDKEIVLEAVKSNPASYHQVSSHLKRDDDVMLEAVMGDGNLLEYISSELNIEVDRNIALEAVKNCGYSLQYCPNFAFRDKEILHYALKNSHGGVIDYFNDEMKSNKEIMLIAVSIDGELLRYCNNILINDQDVVWEAFRQNVKSLKFIGGSLKKNRLFSMKLLKFNKKSFIFIDKEFTDDQEFMWMSMKYFKRICATKTFDIKFKFNLKRNFEDI
jgi:hypothetical protein